MSRLFKTDSLNIKMSPILKLKFHIATGQIWMSGIISNFIQNYVRDYEKQYWIIPVTLTNDIKYDVLTKFFWVQLDKQTYKKLSHESILNLVNQNLGTNLNLEEFQESLLKYPKTRKWIHIKETSTLELIEKNKETLKKHNKEDLQGYWL